MNRLLIIVGSQSDIPLLKDLEQQLTKAKITYDIEIASCHRDLDTLYQLLTTIKDGRYRAVVAVANAVSNMPAIVASYLKDTATVVVGVGLSDKGMNGIDSLLAINTIPKGVPLVTTGLGATGLHNAGLFVAKLF
ncbi:MAG TPA: AIR carboxylase family protein [Candidatus Saccharimonas sp.]|nr:AIR carboxylase family protein [Candidatus Saccharimonas sp.]